ncbi:hypothetical protein Nepgr_012354 [Nepenthes gracilis]|uniref:Uncharacterized protein n=1 Tax=Nepenthes gracilis TaxID=150966 RepID=A0AAD3XN05_NEPGR|nr:hypothetical protein Nepgr_012354 [Nepenthes gracilis]
MRADSSGEILGFYIFRFHILAFPFEPQNKDSRSVDTFTFDSWRSLFCSAGVRSILRDKPQLPTSSGLVLFGESLVWKMNLDFG